MKPERGAALAAAIMTSLDHWQDELAMIQPAPGSEVAKQHLLASMRQASLSLRQLIHRDSSGEIS